MSKFFKIGLFFGGFGPDRIKGSDHDDILFGGFGPDRIDAGRGDDIVFGGFGDDTILGAAGDDRIFGGLGQDTAVYDGGVEDYTVTVKPARGFSPAQATVTDLSGDRDRLQGVERLYFAADDYTADLTGRNNAVLARDDAAAANADAPTLLTGLTQNDFDFDRDTLRISAIDTTGLVGQATLNPDGSIAYDAMGAFDSLRVGETATTTLRYTVTDGRGSSDTATVTITVTGVNDAPDLALADTLVFENSTDVLTAAATDPDGDAVTYSLSGTDAALFVIDASTGALSFATGPDFEAPADADGDNVYDIAVTATDDGGLSATAAVSITVADVDEATAFLNEIHYDNAGADAGEFIEIAGVAGTDLTGWTLALYNGTDGSVYDTLTLAGRLAGTGDTGYLTVDFPANGLQNGSPDAVALVNAAGQVVEFLSYEGTLTATGGPARGLTSADIGVAEDSNTPIGFSLARQADGTWAAPAPATPGAGNDAPPVPQTAAFINEIHYDNAGADTGEFVEIAGPAGGDLTGWTLVAYNGSNGASYNTVALDGALSGSTGQGYAVVDIAGLQNGSPDGLALVDPTGTVTEFLSYEGSFTATTGPALGLTSTDISVAEDGTEAPGLSLQRLPDGSWIGPVDQTPGTATGDTTPPPPPPAPTETTLISTIQGDGFASGFVGQAVQVSAVVTMVTANGFYLQEEDADADGNAATSEGIFVFTGDTPDVDVSYAVTVVGMVEEYFDATQINAQTFDIIGPLADLPTAADISLPFGDAAMLEAVEGMRVSLDTGTADAPLQVIETFELGRYGEIVVSEGPQFQPTQIYDAQTQAEEIAALQQANAANRLTIDDGNPAQNPSGFAYIPNATAGDNGNGYLDTGDDLSAGGTLRIGAEITAPVTGVMTYAFGEYKLVADGILQIDETTNTLSRDPAPADVGGTLQVASVNTLNYFTTLTSEDSNARGATTAEDFLRQTDKLVTAITALDADVIGLQEIENNGFGDDSAIATLVDALNARAGGEVYAFVDPTGTGSTIGTDAITTGLIYRTDAVSVLDSGILDYTPDGESQRNRPTVAAAFEDANGEVVTIAVNHFKSKGGSGTGDDADIGDGQGNFNATRTAAAEKLTAWLASEPFDLGDPDYLIIGDLNAYGKEDPVQAIEAAGYASLLDTLIGQDAFSYTFDGQRGALDQALVSASLAGQVTGITEWHINSLEPSLLGYSSEFVDPAWFNGTDPYSASDHDPLLIGLQLTSDLEVA